MFRWVPYPFLRFTPVFAVGVVLGIFTKFAVLSYVFLTVFFVYGCLVLFSPKKYFYLLNIPIGIVAITSILISGWFISYQHDERHQANHLTHHKAFTHYEAVVTENPQEKDKYYQITVSVVKILASDSSKRWLKASGKVLLMLNKTGLRQTEAPNYGDKILIKGSPKLIKPPSNPGGFDFQTFMRFQNVYHQQFASSENLLIFDNEPPYKLVAFAIQLKKACLNILAHHIKNKDALGVAQALVLGVKDKLNDEIRETYASTGAMHVLAVSGLHVGIIYLIISFLLLPLKKIPGGRWLHMGLCIIILWAYALITGFSPSVMRAATMFSFFIIAQTSGRQNNIYNALGASAFFLLCVNPYLIVSVGFQLSYLAVAGIVFLQPRIYRWFASDYWAVDKIWQLTSVSLAAQAATFPLGLFYFNQFPTYFLISNLLVIPSAFVILLTALFTIISGAVFPPISSFTGIVLEKIIEAVNQGLILFQQLPFSKILFFPISMHQTLLIYGVLLSFTFLFYFRRFHYLIWVFGCVLIFVGIDFSRKSEQSQQQKFTFYNIYQQSIADFVKGKTSLLHGSVNEQSTYTINQAHLQKGLLPVQIPIDTANTKIPCYKIQNLSIAVWLGKTIIFIDNPFSDSKGFSQKVYADYLIISNNAVKDIAILERFFEFSFLIIDSSNHYFTVQKLVTQAKEIGIPTHAVMRQGAFVINIASQ